MFSFMTVRFFFLVNLFWLFYAQALTDFSQEQHVMLQNRPYDILGVGSACMDVLIPVEDSFLAHVPGEKGGSQAIEYTKLKHILALIESTPQIATGGSCANTMKGLRSLGASCALLTNIGPDSFGKHFADYMNQLGVIGLYSPSSLSTPCVLCLITPDGQRTMRFCPGCSAEMTEDILHPIYFQNVKLVHLDSYTARCGDLMRKTMQLAKAAGTLVSIDLSSFEIVREYHALLSELLPLYVDIVFANRDEVQALMGLSPEEGCLKLQEICSIAVVLMGSEGCLVGHQGQVLHSPAFPTQVVDSTGAGDLFASGFLHGYLQGYPLSVCARLGNRLGSAIVKVQGAELPAEKWAELKPYFKNIHD